MTDLHSTLETAFNWRYATKKFNPTRKISDKDWSVLKDSLRMSPSSLGLQPWKFLIAQSPEIKQQLIPYSLFNKDKVKNCSHLVVVAHLKDVTQDYIHHYMKTTSQIRNQSLDSLQAYKEQINAYIKTQDVSSWNTRQTYIATGFFMLTAAMLKIDVCPIEGFISDDYDRILGLSDTDYTSVVIMATGYRAEDDEHIHDKKVRFSEDEVFQVF